MSTVAPFSISNDQLESYIIQLADTVVKQGSLLAGFTTSFLTILVCEVGDKTFFLAMIMATRYAQFIVFLGSYGALFVMTILSTAFGKIATAWISPFFTNIVVTILFFYFGIKMLLDARNHEEEEENQQMKQVQHELEQMESKYIQRHSGVVRPLVQQKQIEASSPTSPSKPKQKRKKMVLPNSHILTQAFVMTFLAQWGDRSQIATIALAASFNPYMVTLGALLGHLICTGAAVKLGFWISGKVTEKQVLTVGGIVFIISGLCTLYLAFEDRPE